MKSPVAWGGGLQHVDGGRQPRSVDDLLGTREPGVTMDRDEAVSVGLFPSLDGLLLHFEPVAVIGLSLVLTRRYATKSTP